MHWMQIGKCLFDTFQISLAESAANIHISRDQRYAVCYRSKSTHKDKFDIR